MKRLFPYISPLMALLGLAACVKAPDLGPEERDAGKELIAFSQEGSAFTRAALTKAGFSQDTKVVLRIKAEDAGSTQVRYTQALATASPETTADDDCNTLFGLEGTHSHLAYAEGQKRFWDDAFGRTSQLTVYAVAVPNQNNETVLPSDILDQNGTTTAVVSEAINPNWYTITSGEENNKINWSVSAKQSADTRLVQDLAYSNNIKADETVLKGRYHEEWAESVWTPGMACGRLIWQPQSSGSTIGKFDKGHLVFRHALSWITLVLKEGAGFNNASNADFTWTNRPAETAQSLKLTGFLTSGLLDVGTGSWSETTSSTITQMDETTGTPAAATIRTLHAYILPGTNLYTASSNVLEFEIDNAKYYVTGTQIAQAIRSYYTGESPYASFTTLEAGKHYIINLNVSKKGIDNITAAILPWEAVNSNDALPRNTYATFNFEDRATPLGQADAAKFGIYRAAQVAGEYITGATTPNYEWKTGYEGSAAKTWSTDHWSTGWNWIDNRTYYHFRAAGTNATGAGATIVTDATKGDYVALQAGAIGGDAYQDYIWGAPFTFVDNSYKIKYSEANGFSLKADGTTYQISHAMGATDSRIKMLLFHVTSQIFVTVKTTTDSYEVTLEDGDNKTSVEILNFLPGGKVRMGTGAVEADGTRDEAEAMTYGSYTAKNGDAPAQVRFSLGMIPQPLTYGDTGTIGLRITTPDGNQYVVQDLSTCTATVSNTNLLNPYTVSSGSLYTINTWYPHYQYNYIITLKKTGIQNITAAVLPWETVSGDLGVINLEN